MNKITITGVVLILGGIAWGTIWRLQSERSAYYDNFDVGYFLIFPGVLTYLSGLNKQSAARMGWRFVGNFLVFIGGLLLCALGQNIATTVYPRDHIYILGWVYYIFYLLLFPLGTFILLKQRK